jgi:hypothetical protein
MNLLNVELVLAVLALLLTIAAGVGRAPIWVAVLLLCVLALTRSLPGR